jgi:hypothetical protein
MTQFHETPKQKIMPLEKKLEMNSFALSCSMRWWILSIRTGEWACERAFIEGARILQCQS